MPPFSTSQPTPHAKHWKTMQADIPLGRKKMYQVVPTGAVAVGIIALCSVSAFSAQSGIASVYSVESGSKTARGEGLNPGSLTAAHRTLPFGTKVRVTHKHN